MEFGARDVALAPGQMEMGPSGHHINSVFQDKKGMLVKQTMRGCLQECIGCTAKSEYKVADMDWKFLESSTIISEGRETIPDELYVLEHSSFCCRCCWKGGRPMNVQVSMGDKEGGESVIDYRKDCGFPACFKLQYEDNEFYCPCCCMLPAVRGTLPNGTVVNESRYLCDQYLLVPKFGYLENGREVFRVRPETCCMNCCIRPRCCDKAPSIAFYFYDPATGEQIHNSDGTSPGILKVWAGLKKECCSTADTFAVFFPDNSPPLRKAGILGMTFLVDFIMFEGD